MEQPLATADARQKRITLRLLVETFVILLGLAAIAHALNGTPLYWPVAFLQGCWFHRLYTAGHEGVHLKLWPGNRRLNDVLGQLLLFPLLVPLPIYRKIHAFHHGFNRRDPHTSALDTWIVKPGAGFISRAFAWISWYLAVFAGGFFLHSLVSVLILVFIPAGLVPRIHRAFRGWTWGDQLVSLAVVATGIGFHLLLASWLTPSGWLAMWGIPLLFFAWVYSLLVYIYHYRTGYGPEVTAHARSLPPVPVFSWWLLNFNEHSTHHARPSLPWWQLPLQRPPSSVGRLEALRLLFDAILAQRKGPLLVEEDAE